MGIYFPLELPIEFITFICISLSNFNFCFVVVSVNKGFISFNIKVKGVAAVINKGVQPTITFLRAFISTTTA